jgi:hypothetical protein
MGRGEACEPITKGERYDENLYSKAQCGAVGRPKLRAGCVSIQET